MQFVPDDFDPPLSLETDDFRLEPLGPEHNERDHGAWMSSIDHIHATPGFPDGNWPTAMSLERNLEDLEMHARHFVERIGFTYSVLDGDDVVGCVYIYPTKLDDHDADVSSWVTERRASLDAPLWQAVSAWIADVWPFASPRYDGR
ncbi:MAG: N-acetyltransferase [Acidimicrobiia bacterium]|nr:N-acetyltransferase [Acidimicrobiia bacterium]